MAIFQLKNFVTFPETTRGGVIRWEFDRAEMIADGVVHILGVVFGLVAATALIILTSIYATPGQIVSVCIYAAGLLAMLGLSATYNLWPVSPVKWFLRRFDHSAIYVLIAATYTPFLAHMNNLVLGICILIGVWCVAAFGIYMKVKWPGRFDRLAVMLYLAMGWSGVMAYDSLVSSLPSSTLWLVAAGGIIYSLGVIFHAWERLRFQNAIWHGFVLLAAITHYAAVLDLVLLSA